MYFFIFIVDKIYKGGKLFPKFNVGGGGGLLGTLTFLA